MEENKISSKIIGAAIEVHKYLGPGLLESAYAACLAKEMDVQGLLYRSEYPVDIYYRYNVRYWVSYRFFS